MLSTKVARERLEAIATRLAELDLALVAAEAGAGPVLRSIPSEFAPSAANLVHYLALRRFDLRELQLELVSFGLSSLGRSEPHVRGSIYSLRRTVATLLGTDRPEEPSGTAAPPLDFHSAHTLLDRRANELLGEVERSGRDTRILVTMPPEAADPVLGLDLLRRLLAAGMDVARINCAHDDEAAWTAMARHVRQAAEEAGRHVRILVDIPGPKVRTGPLPPGPPVAHWRPQRDEFGRPVRAATVALVARETGAGSCPSAADSVLGLPPAFLETLEPGMVLRLRDTRSHLRRLRVVQPIDGGGWIAEAWQTGYAAPGTVVRTKDESGREIEAPVTATPRTPGSITLCVGDRMLLTPNGGPADGSLAGLPRVSCTLPEALDYVRAGDRVSFDDGKIAGVADSVLDGSVVVRITHARPGGSKLRADRGINFPDSPLQIAAVTAADREVLRFVAEHADLVGLSFVNRVEDVRDLVAALSALGAAERVGVLLKIETQRAFENLPALLLEALRTPPVGVMIARGDLAVECGFERMAEVQEEILWMCEAAHVPTIWATQVLETMAKKGLPSRAEITDAAMAERAECAMLNKGPYIVEAVRSLDDILRRMSSHQQKKRSMLRPLRVARGFNADGTFEFTAPGRPHAKA